MVVFVDVDNKVVQKAIELGSEYTPRELLLEQKNHNITTSLIIVTNCNVNFWCLLEAFEGQGLVATLNNGQSQYYICNPASILSYNGSV